MLPRRRDNRLNVQGRMAGDSVPGGIAPRPHWHTPCNGILISVHSPTLTISFAERLGLPLGQDPSLELTTLPTADRTISCTTQGLAYELSTFSSSFWWPKHLQCNVWRAPQVPWSSCTRLLSQSMRLTAGYTSSARSSSQPIRRSVRSSTAENRRTPSS